ncbi:hypothetical protein [Mycobacterium decipiens]|uniref:Uncharacterized protein n=1 Tax=Mycobacterium decipiens TaxID=1430326 RepID=A0A1X2M0J2_9MYCO|nr:hypothetical protein [Mycobacterium decipiens]OSC42561.1 hypothetical protein B8W66_03160 [Mycobacterium decipiens]
MRRALLVVPLLVAACVMMLPTPRSSADAGCAPGGNPPPAQVAERQVGDLDGDGRPDTLWIGIFRGADGATERLVGITTASGANSEVQISSASPIPLRAMAIDAQQNGNHQVIVSDGRSAQLYVFADCRLQTVVDSHYRRPFLFDLEDLAGHGTGIGCSDLGDGRHLVGLQALAENGRWTIHRTEIDLSGTLATIGRSDTLTATSAQDPVVTSAQTISCGDLTIDQDGVGEP